MGNVPVIERVAQSPAGLRYRPEDYLEDGTVRAPANLTVDIGKSQAG